MDFETSCWSASSPLTNGGQTFSNYENSVQRRPKIDYFDSTSITPIDTIVSHISSNGYYGLVPNYSNYSAESCSTTNVTSITDTRSSDNNQSILNDIDFDVTEELHHQGRSRFEIRKRSVQSNADEFTDEDPKRRRIQLSVIDYAEGIYINIQIHTHTHTQSWQCIFLCTFSSYTHTANN